MYKVDTNSRLYYEHVTKAGHQRSIPLPVLIVPVVEISFGKCISLFPAFCTPLAGACYYLTNERRLREATMMVMCLGGVMERSRGFRGASVIAKASRQLHEAFVELPWLLAAPPWSLRGAVTELWCHPGTAGNSSNNDRPCNSL